MLYVPNYLQVRNSLRHAQWEWKWHRQGGGRFWVARGLRDLRNEEDLRRWRLIEFKSRHLNKKVRKVVNIAAWRIARARRRA